MTFSFGEDQDAMDGYDSGTEEEQPQESSEIDEHPIPSSYEEDSDLSIPSQVEEEEYEVAITQVDKRMRIAQFFRLVLDSDLFSDEASEAKIVQSRVRKFVRDELEVLFGMRRAASAPVASQFTQDEVEALKVLASRVTAKPSTPQLKPVQSPVQIVAPSINKMGLNKTPSKPTAKPVAQVPQKIEQKPTQATTQLVDARIPEMYKDDPTVKIKNGKIYVQTRDDDGKPITYRHPKTGKIHPVMKDVTPTARPGPGAIQPTPMASVDQGNMLAASSAQGMMNRLNMAASRNPIAAQLASGLANALKSDG